MRRRASYQRATGAALALGWVDLVNLDTSLRFGTLACSHAPCRLESTEGWVEPLSGLSAWIGGSGGVGLRIGTRCSGALCLARRGALRRTTKLCGDWHGNGGSLVRTLHGPNASSVVVGRVTGVTELRSLRADLCHPLKVGLV
jgi:hypothetical protein